MGLNELKFLKLVFSITAVDKIFLPKNLKSNIFRGAFGLKLKEMNCKSTPICSEKCLDSSCLYGKIFEPYLDFAPSGMKDIPRPFIFDDFDDKREIIYPGESFNISVVLFGWLCDYYAHFIKVIERIGEEGIGPLRGKYLVRNVWSEKPDGSRIQIIDNGILREEYPFKFENFLYPQDTVLKITLKTPTFIKYHSEIIRQPEFYHIFTRIRDRISSIAYFHNGVDLETDYKLLEYESKKVKLLKSKWQWIEVKRRSSKTRITQNLSGIVGWGVYDFTDESTLRLFYPWLKVAEYTNIGKNTVWGMGKIRTEVFNIDYVGKNI